MPLPTCSEREQAFAAAYMSNPALANWCKQPSAISRRTMLDNAGFTDLPCTAGETIEQMCAKLGLACATPISGSGTAQSPYAFNQSNPSGKLSNI